jgi:hypothetical protein
MDNFNDNNSNSENQISETSLLQKNRKYLKNIDTNAGKKIVIGTILNIVSIIFLYFAAAASMKSSFSFTSSSSNGGADFLGFLGIILLITGITLSMIGVWQLGKQIHEIYKFRS